MRATKFEWLEAIQAPTGDSITVSGLAIQRAFENHRTKIYPVTLLCHCKIEALLSSFFWGYTPEGLEFWGEVREFNCNN